MSRPSFTVTSPLSLVGLIDPIHHLCAEAAKEILAVYETEFTADAKADRSPVTEADRNAHKVLAKGLDALTPDIPIISEEGDTTAQGDATHWLVDPLDGTKEFLNRNGQFTVNVALVHEGAPVFGLVQVPVNGRAFAGIPGIGAWKHEAAWQRIQVAPLYRDRPCKVVVSRSHRGNAIEGFVNAVKGLGLEVEEISVGSSLKLCQVAEGAAHVYPRLGPTMHWDTAAAHAVVEGAGGTVHDLDGQTLRYGHGDLRNAWFIAGTQTRWPWHGFVVSQAAPPGKA